MVAGDTKWAADLGYIDQPVGEQSRDTKNAPLQWNTWMRERGSREEEEGRTTWILT